MTATTTAARVTERQAFARMLHAEWTKLRTVGGWVVGILMVTLATVGIGLLGHSSCGLVTQEGAPTAGCTAPLGPGGEAVADSFYLVHRPLAGNGSITVQVTSMTGFYSPEGAPGQPVASALQAWSKAGIIIKASTRQGSAYAAMLVTGSHGVRLQYDFTGDIAGLRGAVSATSPRWLRLIRSGDRITGYDSADGAHWAKVGSATLAGLPSTVQAGLFAASPGYSNLTSQSINGSSASGGPTQARAAFDHVSLRGAWPGPATDRAWSGTDIGGPHASYPSQGGGYAEAAGIFTVTGSGDIAPAVPGGASAAGSLTQTLVGTFAGLIALIIVATLFITAEYRRGLIRVTLAASPRRSQVLAAKAIVIGAVTFVVGLPAGFGALLVGEWRLRAGGVPVSPVPALTEVRMIVGTAALLAVTAVLTLAVGALTRRSAAAVTAVVTLVVLPYFFTSALAVLPAGAADWLLRITPAAAFSIQQGYPRYPQVMASYTPRNGYYPLAPWAGFAVLCAWAALALALAIIMLRRRDA